MDLIVQLMFGAALITLATLLQVLLIGALMLAAPRLQPFLQTTSILRISVMIAMSGLWMIFGQLAGVWVWALALLWLEAFATLEMSLYFSLSAYTTLGFGDVLPPQEWRILGALIGANGMLGFGLATAALVEFVLQIRPK